MVDKKDKHLTIAALTPGPGERHFPSWLEKYRDEKTSTVIIPYSLDAPEPFGGAQTDDREDSKPFTNSQRQALLRHMDHIERIANVKFRDVNKEDPPPEARLVFFQTRPINEEKWLQNQSGGFPGGWMENLGEIEDPKINIHISSRGDNDDGFFVPEKYGSSNILHELLHGLGLTHPEGWGDTPGYAHISAMSYTNVSNTMRFGDMQKLVDMWGESLRDDSVWNATTFAPGAKHEDFIIPENGNSITIDLRNITDTDPHLINLNQRVNTEKRTYPDRRMQIEEGVNIRKIIASDTAPLSFDGDPSSTTVIGGAQADMFYLKPGADTITGNGGGDAYSFGKTSGKNHVITDFVAEDKFFFYKDVSELKLHFIERENGAAALEVETPTSSVRLESTNIKEFDTLLNGIIRDGKIQLSGKTEDDTKLFLADKIPLLPTLTPETDECAALKPTATPAAPELKDKPTLKR
jgi:hypothetical protein